MTVQRFHIAAIIAITVVTLQLQPAEAQSQRRGFSSRRSRSRMSLGSTWERTPGSTNRQYGNRHSDRHQGYRGISPQIIVPAPIIAGGIAPLYFAPSHAGYIYQYGPPNYQFQYGTSSTSFSYPYGTPFVVTPRITSSITVHPNVLPGGLNDNFQGNLNQSDQPSILIGNEGFSTGPHQTATDPTPIANEFEAAPLPHNENHPANQIDSIRFQARGDAAANKGDFTTAQVYYQMAIKRAPSRIGPWIRQAWTDVAQDDFSGAVAHLKRALSLDSDSSSAWITSDQLASTTHTSLSSPEYRPLWKWLEERPASSDRLLLTGAYLTFHKQHDAADEVFAMASQYGLNEELLTALNQLTSRPETTGIPEDRQFAQPGNLAVEEPTKQSAPVTPPPRVPVNNQDSPFRLVIPPSSSSVTNPE